MQDLYNNRHDTHELGETSVNLKSFFGGKSKIQEVESANFLPTTPTYWGQPLPMHPSALPQRTPRAPLQQIDDISMQKDFAQLQRRVLILEQELTKSKEEGARNLELATRKQEEVYAKQQDILMNQREIQQVRGFFEQQHRQIQQLTSDKKTLTSEIQTLKNKIFRLEGINQAHNLYVMDHKIIY
jgi:hypothetical protein